MSLRNHIIIHEKTDIKNINDIKNIKDEVGNWLYDYNNELTIKSQEYEEIAKDIHLLKNMQSSLSQIINNQQDLINNCDANIETAKDTVNNSENVLVSAEILHNNNLINGANKIILVSTLIGLSGGLGLIPVIGLKTGLIISGTCVGSGLSAAFFRSLF